MSGVRAADGLVRLTRPFYNYPYVVWVVLGWVVADDGDGGLLPLLGLSFAVLLACCASTALNDVLDAEKDAVTAPERPIPAGLVSRAAGVRLVIGSYGVAVVVLAATSGSAGVFAASLGCLALLLVLGAAYSGAKHLGLAADLICGLAATPLLVLGGIHGGRVDGHVLLAGLFVFLHEVGCNLGATVSDSWRDGAVGNRTVAARHGPARAMGTALSFVLASTVVVVAMATRERSLLATTLVVGAFVLAAVGSWPILRWDDATLGRREVSAALRPFRYGCLGVACGALATRRPVIALVCGAAAATSQVLGELTAGRRPDRRGSGTVPSTAVATGAGG